jgi:hypothetical protein
MRSILAAGILAFAAWGASAATQDKCDVTTMRALVGPEPGVYLRGQASLSAGKAVIVLPVYFEQFTLATNRSVQLTCKDGFSPLFASAVTGGEFVVQTDKTGNPSQAFWWEVKSVSAEQSPMPRR